MEIAALHPSRIVISPGPCTPKEAGISVEAIRRFGGKVPLLGVCLGHQSLAVAYGGDVIRAPRLMHGKTSPHPARWEDDLSGLTESVRSHAVSLPHCESPESSRLF